MIKTHSKLLAVIFVLIMSFSVVVTTGNNGFMVSAASSSSVSFKSEPKLKMSEYKETSLKLSWSKMSGATGYRLYKYNSKTKKWEKVKTTSSTSTTVKKLKAGTTYMFKVRAYKKSGKKVTWGQYSDALKTSTKPAVVTGFKGSSQTTDSLKLSWEKVSGATGYRVYMYNSTAKKWVKIKNTTSTNYVVDDIGSGAVCKFKIRAYKKLGKKYFWGTASASLSVATKPEKVEISNISPSINTVLIEWKKVGGATGYVIEYSQKKDFSDKKKVTVSKGTTVTKNITNLIGGKTYYFRIRAYKILNEKKLYGAYSSVVKAKAKTYDKFSGKISVYQSKNLPSTHSYYDEYCPAWMSVYTIGKSENNIADFKKEFKKTFGYVPEEKIECKYMGKYQVEGYNGPQDVYRYTVEDSTYQLLFSDFYTVETAVCDDGCPWTGFCVPYSIDELTYDEKKNELIHEMLTTFYDYSGYSKEYVDKSDKFTTPYHLIESGPYRTKDGKIISDITWYFVRGYTVAFNKDVECEDCGEHIPAGTFHKTITCKKYQDEEFRQKWFKEHLK